MLLSDVQEVLMPRSAGDRQGWREAARCRSSRRDARERPAFDAADVGSMKPCPGGERFLGSAFLKAKLSQSPGEEAAAGVVGGGHGCKPLAIHGAGR